MGFGGCALTAAQDAAAANPKQASWMAAGYLVVEDGHGLGARHRPSDCGGLRVVDEGAHGAVAHPKELVVVKAAWHGHADTRIGGTQC